MSLYSQTLLRTSLRISGCRLSTVTNLQDAPEEQIVPFRTAENNPINHTTTHLNKFYTMPSDIKKKLMDTTVFSTDFKKQITTFTECAILVRKPVVEIISYLKQTDYSKPVNKYVIYGRRGTGKTVSLAHIMHFGFMNHAILIHAFWPYFWYNWPRECAKSPFNPNLVDVPLDGALWLGSFKAQNNAALSRLDLKTTKDYTWSQRECTPTGTPLLELVQFGIGRVKFSCAVIAAVLEELKLASTAGKCKTLVIIDGYNVFFTEETNVKNDDRVKVPTEQVSLTEPFLNITKPDWCNGAVILTVDTIADKKKTESDLPRYLLGKKGFEHLDPFLPVQTEDYSESEFETVMEYYKERKWVRQITPEAQKELELLSHRNPYQLMHLTKPL